MKEIMLTKNKIALVDDEDYEYLNQFKWHAASNSKRKNYYARHTIYNKNGKSVDILMHRIILGVQDNYQIDHIDGNCLNNQKLNLRIYTNSQNNRNKPARADNKIGLKGVFKKGKKWAAKIYLQNKQIYLGSYKTAIDAASAYDTAAKKYFGDFAKLNFSNPETPDQRLGCSTTNKSITVMDLPKTDKIKIGCPS